MGQRKRQRTELYNQRVAELLIRDFAENMLERQKFEQLIKKGIIVPETPKGTSAKQTVLGKLDF